MDYRSINRTDLTDLHQFWNSNKDSLYKEMDEKEIESKFFVRTKEYGIISLIATENNEIIGFSSGTYHDQLETAFITCILVKKTHRRMRIGTKLLILLENELLKHKLIRKIDISFFNPIHLEWYIPHTLSSDHPNSPGVEVNSPSYALMHKNDYDDFAIQNAYYLDLKNHESSIDIEEKRNILKKSGIEITYYNPNKHSGFSDLFNDLKSEHWKKEITNHINCKQYNDDILIVEKNGIIYGFAGPLSVQASGRGKFAGIGVHSRLRGLGAGTVLFSSLCMEFMKIGAQYMSIFTGENNKAKHIYEAEGFKVVKVWANMRKEIKKGD